MRCGLRHRQNADRRAQRGGAARRRPGISAHRVSHTGSAGADLHRVACRGAPGLHGSGGLFDADQGQRGPSSTTYSPGPRSEIGQTYGRLSGAAGTHRPGLAALLDYARDGDTVIVTAIDRLGRSVVEVTRTIADLGQRGILLRALREGVDTATLTGRAIAAIMATLAELELELGRERRAASRHARRARGVPATKPPKLSPDRQEQNRGREPTAGMFCSRCPNRCRCWRRCRRMRRCRRW